MQKAETQGDPLYGSTITDSKSQVNNEILEQKTNTESDNGNLINHDVDEEQKIKFKDWGFKVDRLFEVAYRFYKKNENKAFHLSFDIRNQMNALILQARYGNFDSGKAPNIGTLDLIGKRRQYEWSLLKGITKTEAMSKFICTLDDICPFFKAYAEAVKISSGQQLSDKNFDMDSDRVGGKHISNTRSEADDLLPDIHSSLCRQTYNQFKSYAEKQYPNDLVKQKSLISSLQEQYYRQYLSQMHPGAGKISSTDVKAEDAQDGHINSPTSSISQTSGSQTSDKNVVVESNSQSDPEVNQQLPESNNNETMVEKLDIQNNDNPARRSDISAINVEKNEVNGALVDLDSSDSKSIQIHPIELSGDTSVDDQKPDQYQSEIEHPLNQFEGMHLSQQPATQSTSHNGRECCGQTPRIGPFESFPEPKLLENAQQPSIPIDLINPNLPQQKDNYISSSLYNNSRPISLESLECLDTPEYANNQPLPPQSYSTISPPKEFTPTESIPLQSSHDENQEPQSNNRLPELWSCGDSSSGSPLQQSISYDPLEAATLWTKKAVHEFKDSLMDDKQGGVYEVKQGTLVNIQVPTYPDGRYIYWEFATDGHDIGFGLDFVYETNLIQPLALSIYEDSDDDDDELEYEEWRAYASANNNNGSFVDPELGINAQEDAGARSSISARRSEKIKRLANTISIVPTYRRDSHEEVFVGRHKYPGQGYYLLKFDNTYSVIRSKTLYFRICYFI